MGKDGAGLHHRAEHQCLAKADHGNVTVIAELTVAGVVVPDFCVNYDTSSVAVGRTGPDAAVFD